MQKELLLIMQKREITDLPFSYEDEKRIVFQFDSEETMLEVTNKINQEYMLVLVNSVDSHSWEVFGHEPGTPEGVYQSNVQNDVDLRNLLRLIDNFFRKRFIVKIAFPAQNCSKYYIPGLKEPTWPTKPRFILVRKATRTGTGNINYYEINDAKHPAEKFKQRPPKTLRK